jgi:methyl-accepting chemotaxis protein
MSRKLRFPLFAKFLLGCLLLAGLLIVGGTLVVKDETRFRYRGNFLAKTVRRLEGYLERTGTNMTGVTELLADDSELRAALVRPGVVPPPPPGQPGPPAATVSSDPVVIAKDMYESLMSGNGLRPDVFAIVTPANRLVWASPKDPIATANLAEVAAIEKARNGSVFAHRIQLLGGVPFQLSAAPIRAPGSDEIIAALVIGVRLERGFAEFAEQSDDDKANRQNPSLVNGSTVLASSLPPDSKALVGRAVQPDKVIRVKVGDDARDTVKLADGLHDFYGVDLEGYKDGDAGVVGKLYVTRARTNIVDPAAHLPWLEIGVGIALSFAIATLLAFWVTRPIKQMLRQSRDLLAGDTDLTQRIRVSSRDETADLADNINQVFARVHNLATEVQAAAFQVGASSAEISAASRQMLGGLRDQTLKIEGSTAAVTELSASIQQVAGNATQATEVAEQSSSDVGAAVARMEEIRSAVTDAAVKMRELGESSKRIGNIVEVIRQISEQTSMLALNASIEAAHAGEQGRGFGVVADEVSSLARRVGQSAKDIEALIQTVKEQTQAAITSMELGTREVATGAQLVTNTLTGLGKLMTVVKDTGTAVQEQAVVSDEIARNMDAVRHIAGDVLHGSEESVAQSERLHELAFQLEESIAGFNLDGSKIAKVKRPAGKPDASAKRPLLASKSIAPRTGDSSVEERD